MTFAPASRFATLLLASGASAFIAGAPAAAQAWRFQAEGVLGTRFELIAICGDRAEGLAAARAARAEIDRLDRILSGWRADSELSALNSRGAARVSQDLFEVLTACERWRTLTDGAFDHRLGRVIALWRDAARAGTEPGAAALDKARAAARAGRLELDAAARSATLPQGVAVAPEAFAKGYVVDRSLEAARAAAPGLRGALVDIGGDLRTWGQGPDGAAWRIGVASDAGDAGPVVGADGAALATSGRGPGDHVVGGRRFSHLIGREHAVLATVKAPCAADADALATALCLMPPDRGLALVEALPDVEARLVLTDGAQALSTGWTRLVVSEPSLTRPLPIAAAADWPSGYVTAIDYELPRHTRGMAPYLAIWVTDDQNRLVRVVSLLGQRLDFSEEVYVWWRRFGQSRPAMVAALSRPTRAAGRYTAYWDGRTDRGEPAPQGRYTVHVEATRERGGHTYQSIELTLGATPTQGTAAADDELGATTVRYGPR